MLALTYKTIQCHIPVDHYLISVVFSLTSYDACVSLVEDVFGFFLVNWQATSCVSSHHSTTLQLPIAQSVPPPHPSPESLVMVSFAIHHQMQHLQVTLDGKASVHFL